MVLKPNSYSKCDNKYTDILYYNRHPGEIAFAELATMDFQDTVTYDCYSQ